MRFKLVGAFAGIFLGCAASVLGQNVSVDPSMFKGNDWSALGVLALLVVVVMCSNLLVMRMIIHDMKESFTTSIESLVESVDRLAERLDEILRSQIHLSRRISRLENSSRAASKEPDGDTL